MTSDINCHEPNFTREGAASGDESDNGAYSDTHAPDAGLSSHDFGISCDAV
jgi:hypothetical protein